LAIERIVVFPMAVVPNLWGLWNILYVALLSRRHVSIGLFGAVLPFLLAPGAYVATRLVGFAVPAFVYSVFPFFFPVVIAIYYLAWKYLVASLNTIVGVAYRFSRHAADYGCLPGRFGSGKREKR